MGSKYGTGWYVDEEESSIEAHVDWSAGYGSRIKSRVQGVEYSVARRAALAGLGLADARSHRRRELGAPDEGEGEGSVRNNTTQRRFLIYMIA